MLNKPYFKHSLIACISIIAILFSVQWLAYFLTPEIAVILSIPFWIVFIMTIISSFKEIFSLPPNLPHFKIIRILAYSSPLFGVLAGLLAFEHNNRQVPYLVWYPILVNLFLVVILGGLTYLVKRINLKNLNKNNANLPSSGSKWFGIIIIFIIFLIFAGAFYQLIDNSMEEKRLENYGRCLVERYGANDYTANSKDAKERPNDRCKELTRKKWGFN